MANPFKLEQQTLRETNVIDTCKQHLKEGGGGRYRAVQHYMKQMKVSKGQAERAILQFS